jgi:hypothetical protein
MELGKSNIPTCYEAGNKLDYALVYSVTHVKFNPPPTDTYIYIYIYIYHHIILMLEVLVKKLQFGLLDCCSLSIIQYSKDHAS